MAGLAVDIGRMYVAKGEAQTFTDSAAIEAALQLDGTTDGLNRAAAAVAANPKRWQFGTTAFGNTPATFSTALNGPYSDAASASAASTYARVYASASVPVYFLPIVAGSTSSTVSAAAVAGRLPKTDFTGGFFPFSPISHKDLNGTYRQVCNGGGKKGEDTCIAPGAAGDPNDPNDPFGMKKGTKYTLRAPGPSEKTECEGDANDTMRAQRDSHDRGYISGYPVNHSNKDIGAAILGDMTSNPPLKIGDPVPQIPGARNNNPGNIADRVAQDSDELSATYADYSKSSNQTGNGRRVIVAPINSGDPSGHVIRGFAAFFLLKSSEYSDLKGNEAACAEYIGPWIEGDPFPAGSPPGAYVVRLLK
jgi:hypothetical protein